MKVLTLLSMDNDGTEARHSGIDGALIYCELLLLLDRGVLGMIRSTHFWR